MNSKIKFHYKEEFWFISAFINNDKTSGDKISKTLESIVENRISRISEKDAFQGKSADLLVLLAQKISINCKWFNYIPNFPYYNENTNLHYDSLGYFQFDIEYFKDDPEKKAQVEPNVIQQIPYIVLNEIKQHQQTLKEEVYFDLESPIYIFATSNKTDPPNIKWDQDTIERYKHDLSYWTVLYSGQWEDYSPTLYEERIKNNLSNRLSELHYIQRNSGFVFLAPQSYKDYFTPYIKPRVIDPAAQMRAIIFALREINMSLDLLFLNTHSEGTQDVEKLEEKINNLRFLRGILQNALSTIYNELDYNRRQHYTKVLRHLIDKFDLNNIKERVNQKFDLIYNTMQEIHQKRIQKDQEQTEKALNILNFLLGAGILADLTGLLMIAFGLNESDFSAILLNAVVAIMISSVLILAIVYYFLVKFKVKKDKIRKTVDGILLNKDENKIVLIKRKYPPFQGFYALPGGFIEKGESPEKALKREIKEETNLDIKIIEKIGLYDEPGRDPRGEVHSTTFLCKITGPDSDIKGKSDALSAEFIPLEKLSQISFAFDHRKMLKDAQLIE